MAENNVNETSGSFSALPSADDLSSNATCWLLSVPNEILQFITVFLSAPDIISLSKTCRTFYALLNADDFWIYLIKRQFPESTAQLYTTDLFKKPVTIQSHDKIRQPGFLHDHTNSSLDVLAINSATHYNDEAIEKRHEQMYVSKEDFLNSVQFYQYKKPNNHSTIPFMKVIYYYLIDRKRTAAADMEVVHRNSFYLVEENDADSLTGRIISLRSVCWLQINGQFEHKIMPGKYEVSWRMKTDQNGISLWGITEFIVVPQHGNLLNYQISDDDFRTLAITHGDRWFVVKMGQIVIYEPSNVLVAIRNWNNPSWKHGLSWDCIELAIAS